MNSLLSDLVLEGNPLALEKNYKSVVRGFVLSLKKLDGKPCNNGLNITNGSYADSYNRKQILNVTVEGQDKKLKQKSPQNQKSILCTSFHDNNNQSALSNNEETVCIDGWSSNLTIGDTGPFTTIQMRSPVPWRNPPSITPRGIMIMIVNFSFSI